MCCKYLYIFSVFIYAFVCANIFGAIVLKPRFKIDVVVVIWSIVIIINSVLTLQVSTASLLPHDREPCEIKVVSNHTCSLHTCVCAGSRRERVRLSGLIKGRNQFHSWGSPQVPHSGPGLWRTGPNGIIRGLGETVSGKNQKQKISWHCPFNGCILRGKKYRLCNLLSGLISVHLL